MTWELDAAGWEGFTGNSSAGGGGGWMDSIGGMLGGMDWGSILPAAGGALGGFFDMQQGQQSAADLSGAYKKIGKQAQKDAYYASGRADPYAEYRGAAADKLSGVLSGKIDWRTDPGYKFRMDEAMRETERAGASRGFNRSGNVMAALNDRAQGVASEEYGNIINRLTGLAGATPQNAIAGGQVYGNMMGNVYSAQLGQAANASQTSSGKGGMAGGIGSLAGSFF